MHQALSVRLCTSLKGECDKHSLHPAGPHRPRLRLLFLFHFIMAAHKLQTQPIKQDSDYGLKDASVAARLSIHTVQLVPFQIRGSVRRCVIGTWTCGYLSGAALVYRLILGWSLLGCVVITSSQLVVVSRFLLGLATSRSYGLAVLHLTFLYLLSTFNHVTVHFNDLIPYTIKVLLRYYTTKVLLILINYIFIGIDPHFCGI